ncbi:hypothetical protein ANO11243_095240 [Dothideomycetidae sp. 11243]|nr:hypothetical protein ANO11243_095240 [fungal sp. No.11243]
MNGTNATLNGTRHAEFVALSQIIAQYPLSILQKTDLYVTVEPCIMCASALRQFRIRAVYFGCLNERFGGCGGVMRLNSDPGVDPPYVVYGGLFREEAIMLLRRFYVQENEKAPEPKPKKNRELKTEILPVEVAHAGNPPPVPALPLTLNSKQTVIPHVPPPVPVAVLQTVSEGNVPMLPPPSPVAAVPAENVAQASLTAAEEAPQSRSKSDMASLAERVREITLDIGKKMSVPAKKENVKEPSSNKENVKELSIKENVKQSSTTDKVKQPSKTLPNDAKLPLQSPPGGREPSSPDRIAAARQA